MLKPAILSPWNLSSRIHQLNHFPNQGVDCYVKRDDELGCGISGSKLRKYSSLIPHLCQHGIKHLVIIAGPQSNNLLAALQVAGEYQLKVTAFLIKPWRIELKGNYKLSRLFLDENNIVWVDRAQWPTVETKAQAYMEKLTVPSFLLKEGASVSEAMDGALTLAEDIIQNERTLGFSFQHVFIDSGSGFSAAALIKGFASKQHQAIIHVLLLADDEMQFTNKLRVWIEDKPSNYRCFYPPTAKSFGAVNQAVLQEVKRMAKEEGILVDPIYSAKLFLSARQRITIDRITGKVLIIHSGGALSLAGADI